MFVLTSCNHKKYRFLFHLGTNGATVNAPHRKRKRKKKYPTPRQRTHHNPSKSTRSKSDETITKIHAQNRHGYEAQHPLRCTIMQRESPDTPTTTDTVTTHKTMRTSLLLFHSRERIMTLDPTIGATKEFAIDGPQSFCKANQPNLTRTTLPSRPK